MKNRIIALTLVLASALSVACTHEKYAYVGDAPRNQTMTIDNQPSAVIQPSDKLYIYVYSLNLSSVRPFNQETNMTVSDGGFKTTDRNITGYTVSSSGDIIFPVVGRIHAAGKTMSALEREIEARLVEGRLVKDPIVSVSLMNFNVTVIGEVKVPQMIAGDGTRMTIFEAIAQCGDVTMDGQRDKVTIIRRNTNEYTVDTVDLTSRHILESPYYYLQSGDVVYVEPTETKKRTSYRNEDWPTYLTTGISALRIAYTLYYRYGVMKVQNRLK